MMLFGSRIGSSPWVRRVPWWAMVPLTLIPFLLLGCGTSVSPQAAGTSPSPNSAIAVNIVATDFAFTMPDTVPAGLVHFTFVNQGKELHHAQLFKLKDGVTSDQFLAALKQGGPAAARTYSAPFGGPNMTPPGSKSEVINLLQPGVYMAVCLVHPKGEEAHVSQGMVKKLTVTGSAQTMTPFAVKVTGVIDLIDMQIVLPGGIKAGQNIFLVRNNGVQPHAVELLKLADGKMLADAQPYFSLDTLDAQTRTALPFQIAGGFGAILPQQRGYMLVSLEAGKYLAVCPVTDASTGKQHFMEGMVTSFTVS